MPSGFAKLNRFLPLTAWESVEKALGAYDDAMKALCAEAVGQRKDPSAFSRWYRKQTETLRAESLRAIHDAGNRWDTGKPAATEQEWSGWANDILPALRRLIKHVRALNIPATLRGRTRGSRLDPETLLGDYEEIHTKARTFLREHRFRVGRPGPNQYATMRIEFPEANPKDLETLEHRRAGALGVAVLARREDGSPHTIRKHLIGARKATSRARPKSRIR